MAKVRPPNKTASRSPKQEKPYQPAIGREFDGVQEADAKTRGFLARLIASTTVAAVAAAGIYSLFAGSFTAIIAVWSVAGPIIGAVVTYYFGRNDSG